MAEFEGSSDSLSESTFHEDAQSNISISYDNREISYAELRNLKDAWAKSLHRSGIHEGDPVIYWGRNHPNCLALLYACESVGAVFVPLSRKTTRVELERVRDSVNAAALVTDESDEIMKFHRGEQILDEISRSEGGGVVLMTSGSTGNPKPVIHSWRNLVTNASIAASGQSIDRRSTILCSLTMAHTGGLNMQLLPALIRGARILIGANLEASEFIALQKKNPTHTILVPSQVRLFWRRSNFHRLISPSLRTVVTGSAVVDEVVWRRLAAVFPRVIGVYGLTEMGPYVCTTESYISPREETLSCLGQPVDPYLIRIENEEIQLRGPCRARAFGQPADSGWLKTGDRGVMDGGLIYFRGREARTINVSGFKVNPLEVEKAISEIPGVHDCAVIGEVHPLWGEVPVAVIVGRPSLEGSIRNHLRQRLASYKNPRHYRFVKELPRTQIGKVDYPNLFKKNAG